MAVLETVGPGAQIICGGLFENFLLAAIHDKYCCQIFFGFLVDFNFALSSIELNAKTSCHFLLSSLGQHGIIADSILAKIY